MTQQYYDILLFTTLPILLCVIIELYPFASACHSCVCEDVHSTLFIYSEDSVVKLICTGTDS